MKKRFLTPAQADIRADLRRLYESSPVAFKAVMQELINAGDRWMEKLPPIEMGKNFRPRQVNDTTLALLLADYRNAQTWRSEISRDDFLERVAEEGGIYGNRYFVGTWETGWAVRRHLKAAEAKAKTDREFAAKVDWYQEALADLGAGSLSWD